MQSWNVLVQPEKGAGGVGIAYKKGFLGRSGDCTGIGVWVYGCLFSVSGDGLSGQGRHRDVESAAEVDGGIVNR